MVLRILSSKGSLGLAFAGSFLISAAANSQMPQPATGPYRTSELLPACKLALIKHKTPERSEGAFMVYFMEGLCMGAISTTMRLAPQMNDQYKFCPPSESTPQDIVPAILDFVDKNPKLLPYDIRDVANYVGRQRWPCS